MSSLILDILSQICLKDRITVVVSLHTLEFARAYADRVVALKNGQVFFEGAIKDLAEDVVENIF